jgi:hypothetical protein
MYTPIREIVPTLSIAVSFYRNRGEDDGTINLNRPSGVIIPTGLFCCEVPDFAGDSQSLCVYIG